MPKRSIETYDTITQLQSRRSIPPTCLVRDENNPDFPSTQIAAVVEGRQDVLKQNERERDINANSSTYQALEVNKTPHLHKSGRRLTSHPHDIAATLVSKLLHIV